LSPIELVWAYVKRNILGNFCARALLADQGQAGPALRRYALRWTAEHMHQALKSRGFFLESTHLTQPARVSTLLAVIALAFVWCRLVGELEERRDPSRCLRRGYPPKSLFRRGLDPLRTVLSKPKSSSGREFPLLFLTPREPSAPSILEFLSVIEYSRSDVMPCSSAASV